MQKSSNRSTEKRILNESMRLFLERGYHGTSIDNITQAAGLTKGALYWHFKSKEALLLKILEEFEKLFLDELISSVDQVKSGAYDRFAKYFQFNAAFAYYNRELCVCFTTLAAEIIGAHHTIEPQIRRIYRKYQKFLSKLIRQGRKEKIFREDLDADLGALVIMAFHDGILLQWSMNKNELDGEAFVKTFTKIMLDGLRR